MPACDSGGEEHRSGVQPGHADEGGQPQRGHQIDRPIRDATEQRIARPKVADQQTHQQRTHACTERDLHAADWERNQHPDQSAKEDGQTERNEVGGRRGRDHRPDPRGRARHHRLWPDHLQQIPALERDAGSQAGIFSPPRVTSRR